MRALRRSDRALSVEASRRLLERAPVGRMATAGPNGPYVTPLSFVYIRPDTVYFHCARSGHKLDNIAGDPRVCFEVDECLGTRPGQRASQCTVKYRSALAFGRARFVIQRGEKTRALEALVAKYADMDYPGLTAAEIDGVTVVAIDIEHISGKSNCQEEA